MRTIHRTMLLLGTGAALAGCGHTLNSLESQARIDPRTVAAYPNIGENILPSVSACDVTRLRGDSHNVVIDLDCFRFPNSSANDELAYQLAAETIGDRNRLAAILIKHSDDVCVKEMGDLSAREAISNTVLGAATSALSTVSSIVTGEKLKSWLSGGATFTNATRDHINSEVFRNVLASAMAKAIQGAREVQRKELLQTFSSTIPQYSVDQMIMDVNRYHQTCSFYNGLVLVVDAVNRASPSIANDYREKSAAIADLNVAIADVERRLAESENEAIVAALKTQIGELVAQRTKLLIERSNLGSIAPPSEPPDETDG